MKKSTLTLYVFAFVVPLFINFQFITVFKKIVILNREAQFIKSIHLLISNVYIHMGNTCSNKIKIQKKSNQFT